MAQPQYCSRCGAEIVPQQNFCATCGLPRALQSAEQAAPPLPIHSAPSFAGGPQTPLRQPQTPQIQYGAPLDPAFDPAPASGKRKIGRTGIALLLIACLLVVIAIGYTLLRVPGVSSPTQAPISRTNIDTHITYASVGITILNAQQARNFLDDPRTTSDGMARLQIQARNTLQQPVALAYNDTAHLILPGGKEIAALYTSASPTIAAGATRIDTIDFALPTNVKIDQLILRLGRANEAQLDIPLNGHADEGKYATKTVKIGSTLTYLNMNWTLVDASSQLSFDGRQASKGMRYVTLTFSIDNPLTEIIIPGSPYTYMHLKTTTAEIMPVGADMPVSLDPGVVGKTGSATFQVPQESTTLILNLSMQGSSGFDPATTTFQL